MLGPDRVRRRGGERRARRQAGNSIVWLVMGRWPRPYGDFSSSPGLIFEASFLQLHYRVQPQTAKEKYDTLKRWDLDEQFSTTAEARAWFEKTKPVCAAAA